MKIIFAFILAASMLMSSQANAGSRYACTGGIISLGNSADTVDRKCYVVSKKGSHWTVKGKFKGTAIVTIQRGRVTIINK